MVMGSWDRLKNSWRWRSSFAYYGFLRRLKSRKNPAISWKTPDPAAPRLVSCVYAADVPLLRQCLKTLHETNSRPPAALLAGDSPEAVDALRKAFSDGGGKVEIVFWENLLEKLPEQSRKFIRAWLNGGAFGGYAKKFAVTLAANQDEALVMCDADVLFGGDFFAALKGCLSGKDGMVAGEDYRASYDLKAVNLLDEPRILGGRPLNCGMVYYPRGVLGSLLTEAVLEKALPLADPADNHLEQTLVAYAFWRSGGSFFPRTMLETSLEDNLKWRKGLGSLARHYAGGKHLFWRDV